ncbi:hypothetical protein BRD19_02520 [Halobacteriales archaeon SW_7_65_23]|nr:MAG: hypothetical protein BRD19_02520 [Halobacteriales archaeon SW_7_65_23]
MAWQSTPWADPLLAATAVSGSLAVFGLLYVLSIRRDRRVVAFATVMVAVAVWTLGYSFQFASATLPGKRQWALVAMVGEAVVPTAWFTFAAAYAGYDEWLRTRVLTLLWLVPALTVLLTATNDVHGLVWAAATLGEAPDGGYLILERAGGPWLLVHGAYSYLVAAAGVVVIIGLIERSRHIYRGQALVLFGGIFVAVVAHMVSLAGAGPAAAVDLTGPSLSVLGIAFAIGIFQYRMFDLVPVARASIVENMGEGYVLLDRGTEVVDVNAAARSLLRAEGGRLIGRPAREAFAVDLAILDEFDGEPTTSTVAIEAAATTPTVGDTAPTGEDAGRRYLELTVSAIEADGVEGRFLWVRDVTDRIRLERRFQTLIERSSDVVFRLDEDGIVRYASPSTRRVLGYEPADLEDEVAFEELLVEGGKADDREEREDGDRTPLDRHATATETWNRLVGGDADGDTVRFEVQLRTAAGEVRFIEAVARYLVDDPAVGGIVINARDVTERTEQELELRRTNERLDQFASLVGHDLRNPLTVATGHLEMAMETGDTDSLETVREQHQRMEAMIEDLLSLAREGRTVEDPSPVALAAAARQSWSTVDTRGASLAVDADPDAAVLADESRLYNLFENLFRNAVEHGPGDEGGGIEPADLTVSVEAIPEGFAVGDDGVGIPADKREQVLESGHTTRSGNTGFGLAIVEEVAAAHGWEVRVTESAAGGARFEFTGVDRPATTAPDAATGEVD